MHLPMVPKMLCDRNDQGQVNYFFFHPGHFIYWCETFFHLSQKGAISSFLQMCENGQVGTKKFHGNPEKLKKNQCLENLGPQWNMYSLICPHHPHLSFWKDLVYFFQIGSLLKVNFLLVPGRPYSVLHWSNLQVRCQVAETCCFHMIERSLQFLKTFFPPTMWLCFF